MQNYNSKFKKAGFTLVETLVAVSILSISIAATFTAVQNGIQNSTVAKDQTTAFYLAQEAIEYIKNLRDQNALNSINGGANKWLTGLSDVGTDPCYFGKVCRIDSPAQTTVYCGAAFDACPVLNQDSSTGLFGYTAGWTPTIFKREIQFRQIVADREVEVTIRMSWTSRWGGKSFQVTETLFNRQ
ncbi:MAG: type II secretion system protein [Candidatus Zambryskibacteria bacterium]|nr:type II secretion system protein [Candidatus Zambryskibacteria bacterium]